MTADYTRTCEGCEHIRTERGAKAEEVIARCFAPGWKRGSIVSDMGMNILPRRFLPYVPAWCPLMQEKEAAVSKAEKRKNRR